MKILLVGPQGSGKSTQSKILTAYLQVPYVSTGDIFRQIASQDTDQGKKIKQIIESGQLVDDQTTAKMVENRLNQADCQNGFIMDGYPRNIAQANRFDSNFDKVIYINIPDGIVLERLLKRGRTDDTKESIKTRLDLYREKTQPLLDFYKKQGILMEIDGTGDIPKIQDEIKKSL